MKRLFILLCITVCASSCSKNLSKDEALRQINVSINKDSVTTPFQSYFVLNDINNAGSDIPTKIENAKRAGYLDCSTNNIINTVGGRDVLLIMMYKDKFKKEIVSQQSLHDDYLGLNYTKGRLRGGVFEAEIVSMTEPGTDLSGRKVCTVEYKYKFIPTEIHNLFDNPIEPGTAKKRFIKMENDWKIDND